ncbi:uncharacterized protein AMSG_02057 [Thecamonas trahens ATCC 50062]|uniref:Calcineurin-like phosphoesterase domain-containing protein n=1 Tax=Thecamonas trahens ATCC 50062 TaxID=461836 RepID=A0A0L0DUZ2_THETB|nr:hypothetical protein AMSG_02057 [Thecamonas trahens ATCC 50062]KNC56045.1 hypothetical protein AMSG_02057 [Thecamonas trahens ATCC 50062]|eukprot:XP_013761089.1 hypothetical protein AMSG_02057 [Thecamonas trahens ATCC 50062]
MDSGRPIGYVTDVEGNAEYFCRYVEESTVVCFATAAPDHPARLGSAAGPLPNLVFTPEAEADGAVFVYGGDVCDKGNGDLRVIACLLAFKEAFPERVFLLVGNRDVNKLRFSAELAHPTPADDMFTLYWVEEAKRKLYPDYLVEKGFQDTPSARLRWMLDCTMGSEGAFDRRREELAILAGAASTESITDAQVYASYVGAAAKGGVLHKYLLQGQIAALVDGTLFVHGAVNDANIGYVPPLDGAQVLPSPAPGIDTLATAPPPELGVAEWVAALNAWYNEQMAQWDASPQWEDPPACTRRGGNSLMDYGVPGGWAGAPPSARVLAYLAASGVTRVITGHTPHGQSPTVMVVPAGGDARITFVIADTSYSDMSAPDNRGSAITAIAVSSGGSIRFHGQDRDGLRHDFVVPTETHIGALTPDGFRVKTREASSGTYVLTRTRGFAVELVKLDEERLCAALESGVEPSSASKL